MTALLAHVTELAALARTGHATELGQEGEPADVGLTRGPNVVNDEVLIIGVALEQEKTGARAALVRGRWGSVTALDKS